MFRSSSNPGRGGDEPSVSSEFHKDIYFLLYPTWKPTLIIIFEHYVQNQRIYKTPSSGNHKTHEMLCYMSNNSNFDTPLPKSQDDAPMVKKFCVEIIRKRKLICYAGKRRGPLALLFVNP